MSANLVSNCRIIQIHFEHWLGDARGQCGKTILKDLQSMDDWTRRSSLCSSVYPVMTSNMTLGNPPDVDVFMETLGILHYHV